MKSKFYVYMTSALLCSLLLCLVGCQRAPAGGQGVSVSSPTPNQEGFRVADLEDTPDVESDSDISQVDSMDVIDGAEDIRAEDDPNNALQNAFFGWDAVRNIEITLSTQAQESLDEFPAEYVMGTISLDGEVMGDVGVRLKGKWGSFRPLTEKAAFLIKFNEFVSGQNFVGMKKLALNNMVQDASMMHEQLAYLLFRESNVPSSRTGYAWVRVNNEDYGLYTTVEVVDNDHFRMAWFGGEEGYLYEGEYGVDLFDSRFMDFDQDSGKDKTKEDLAELVASLDALEDAEDLFGELDQLFDMERFVAFAAIELVLGHWDGYAWTQNNYFIYRPEDSARWTFMPWGLDQTFQDHLYPFHLYIICSETM